MLEFVVYSGKKKCKLIVKKIANEKAIHILYDYMEGLECQNVW